ncbi:MAG: tetratricopeptide repeat protein [Fimbriimonadaceae bacterium]|jgi:tetratricopeptide (TPR) repeat protein|nr:tetratricopeptide repeat protein [Fimbriimonadaceae bacterium]
MKIRLPFVLTGLLVATTMSHAQFVWPKPEYNKAEPGTYVEDPFIIKYRAEFFAIFRGDVARFERAYGEIREMVRKNPRDARATVWLGNGQTVDAIFKFLQKKADRETTLKRLEESRTTMNRAVALRRNDPNIVMMRAATLFVQGQYLPADMVPRKVWEQLRDDHLWFQKYIGPERMKKVSIHVRGETYGSLGLAYARLGDSEKARRAFEKVIEMNPGTAYERRARLEINRLAR